MRLLVDTHALLWYLAGARQLSTAARGYLDDRQNHRYVSMASLWEIAIKVSLGKLQLLEPYETLIPRMLQANDLAVLDISLAHVIEVAGLPFPSKHRDPFDRVIAAQARIESLPLLSVDQVFDDYGVRRIW